MCCGVHVCALLVCMRGGLVTHLSLAPCSCPDSWGLLKRAACVLLAGPTIGVSQVTFLVAPSDSKMSASQGARCDGGLHLLHCAPALRRKPHPHLPLPP